MLRSVLETTTFADLVERSRVLARPGRAARARAGRPGEVDASIKSQVEGEHSTTAGDEAGLSDRRQRLAEGGRGHREAAGAVCARVGRAALARRRRAHRRRRRHATRSASSRASGWCSCETPRRWTTTPLPAIVDYLRSPAPETCLGLFGGAGFGPKHPLVKAVEAVGEVRLFDAPERKQAAEWVVRRFADARVDLPARRRPPAGRAGRRGRRRPGARDRQADRLLRRRGARGRGRRAAGDRELRHQAVGHHRRLGPAATPRP